ncbi:MAG: flagella basal body P-ring formation protein FlgA [Elusimicrobia bacterium]|jgi:hypothetical protein|nr:flagella basal body P-ring formation protein FlgA [Elusimicrobiota bacterium]
MKRSFWNALIVPCGFLAAFPLNAWETTAYSKKDVPASHDQEDLAVRRGQQILLVALADGIRLSAPGRALKNGQTGDIIPVLNTATRKPLKGIVRDGWVEIQAFGESNP